MRKRLTLFLSAIALVAAAALYALWPASAATSGLVADHALIDQTGGDTFVQCKTTNGRPFIVYASMRAFGGDVTMRVLFQDGDQVDYLLAQDDVFSLQQAAGETAGVDRRIRIVKAGGSGSLVGWMSASRVPGSGSFVACRTS
jgi:hypothetical protein